ncbi:NAD(P)-binding protein [Cryphonectria parasitica EP155]|uniref:NAD(P)-binding protein n=1 Tax=Cryphonectria parasitica (strain ATCC 38755 / EP155) TaxID=660469 RepID=A0A9P4Y4S0_CRYP1|nr:NAD(P)-binding protein [Cryphonectria parasitica EP155]KAF3766523.1 NAD(P)-binding protein [Cryphonectria parasitica EP155]
MQILLLGATGRTGMLVLQETLNRGHTVTALVRNPGTLLSSSAAAASAQEKGQLNVIQGTPLEPSDVARAIETATSTVDTTTSTPTADAQQLVVISTLNARRTTDNPFAAPHPTDSAPRMMADSTANVLSALSATHRRGDKIVVLSALGAGSSAPHTHWALRALFRHSGMRYQYADHDAVEQELRRGTAVFVMARPTRLVEEKKNEEASGEKGAVAKVFDPSRGGTVGLMATVSRDAVARFLVDAAEGSRYDGQAPILVG